MDNADERNIRPVLQLLGDQGLVAQGAQNEILVSLLKSELGFSIPITIATLPTIGVSSLPNLVVSTMPSLTANPTKHTLLTQVLLGGTDTTIYTAAAAYRDVLIYLNNVDSSARTAQVSLGALDDTHSLVKAFPLAVGDRRVIEVPALANSDVLRGLCDSANKVTAEVWGIAV